ncbi:MAG: nodulation protein NfeD [Thaumarchaeota archaeon]|nr:nodulation protein NfeD [Nitrososphaerota archaeon]
MNKLRLLIAAALALTMLAQGGPVHAQDCATKDGFFVASLNGDIDPGAADFLSASVDGAMASCAGHFIFILTTNGGDGGSMEKMIASLGSYQQWGGTFVTLVAPQGAFAFSAGSYIAEASTKVYMVPGTTIGSATPIVSGIPTGQENSTLRKDINAFTAYMKTLTASHGRNETAAGLMVTQGLSYTCVLASHCEALDLHVIDGALNATSIQGALSLLGAPESVHIETPGIRSQMISILSNPNVSSLLFLIGVFAILADVYHPTVVLSVVGAVMVAAALFGFGVFGASPFAVLLMVIGAAFIFLEVKTQHGISATIGVVIFVVGFLLIFQLPPSSPTAPTLPPVIFSEVPSISYALIAALGVAIVIASLYLRSIRQVLMKRPKVNDPSQAIGKSGTMKTDLPLGGKGVALVGAEDWSVTSAQELKKGDAIKVKEVMGLQLLVEKEQV